MQVEVGKIYHINYDGKVRLKVKVFDVYETKNGQRLVEWGDNHPFVLEPMEQFLEHIKAA